MHILKVFLAKIVLNIRLLQERHTDYISDFLQKFLKKLDIRPKTRAFFCFLTESNWTWRHFGDRTSSQKIES